MIPAASSLAPRRTLREGALDFALIAIVIGVIAGTVKFVWRGFTFWGDNAESFFPLWHMYGTALRQGDFFLFDSDGWGAANVVGEAAYGVFNPVTAVNAILMSLTDRISLAGFVVIVEFMVLLGWGVYMLARTYGASRTAAVIAATIAPFTGYTLFYEAGNWASGLMSIVWVTHFWWSTRTFAGGRIGPLTPILFGMLAATVGNPYSTVGILVVLFVVGLELLITHRFRRFSGLVVVGVAVGTAVLLTYLPLIAALAQIDRPVDGLLVENSNYLTPTISDLLGMSAPSYLPRITAWYRVHDLVPSTYLSWLILPLLPWVRWRKLGGWRANMSLLASILVFIALTLGPDRIWLFRWPIRFVEYLYLGVIILFAITLSHGLATDRIRRRVGFTVFAVAVGLYLSWSSMPTLWLYHVFFALVISVLLVVMRAVNPRWGIRGVAALAIAGTAVIAPIQGAVFGWSQQSVAPGVDQRPPSNLAIVRDSAIPLSGRVLQIAELDTLIGTDAVSSGKLVFGNIGAAAGIDIINRYTGIGFEQLKDGLALDYRGSVQDYFALTQLLDDVSDDFPIRVVDALGVDTLVVQANRRDIDKLDEFTDWKIVERDDIRVVLQRRVPIAHPVVFASDDVTVSDATSTGNGLTFTVTAPTGGTVLVDRLAWSGYQATLDGEPITIETAPFGLIALDIPPGADGEVELTYVVPGLMPGITLALIGLLIGITYQVLWWRRRPEEISDPALNVYDERELDSNYII